jgi:2-oxo-4-hydroxy-4-carboxy--5-ureidoimidazoline (OHCU) decarboxylase
VCTHAQGFGGCFELAQEQAAETFASRSSHGAPIFGAGDDRIYQPRPSYHSAKHHLSLIDSLARCHPRGKFNLALLIASIVERKSEAMALSLPPIESVPALSTEERAAILDTLFEPSTQLHSLSLELMHDNTFPSYDDMISSIGVQLTDLAESKSTSDTEWLEKILASHPRLGEKTVDSAQSRAEQAQLKTGGSEEATQLASLNEEYEKTFPGLRYVYESPPLLNTLKFPFPERSHTASL